MAMLMTCKREVGQTPSQDVSSSSSDDEEEEEEEEASPAPAPGEAAAAASGSESDDEGSTDDEAVATRRLSNVDTTWPLGQKIKDIP